VKIPPLLEKATGVADEVTFNDSMSGVENSRLPDRAEAIRRLVDLGLKKGRK
jgi:hypothetical protein